MDTLPSPDPFKLKHKNIQKFWINYAFCYYNHMIHRISSWNQNLHILFAFKWIFPINNKNDFNDAVVTFMRLHSILWIVHLNMLNLTIVLGTVNLKQKSYYRYVHKVDKIKLLTSKKEYRICSKYPRD